MGGGGERNPNAVLAGIRALAAGAAGVRLLLERAKLDARDFGVAQTRRRLFVIGDRQADPLEPRTYRKKCATAGAVINGANGKEWSYTFSPVKNGRRAEKTIERAERAIEVIRPSLQFISL